MSVVHHESLPKIALLDGKQIPHLAWGNGTGGECCISFSVASPLTRKLLADAKKTAIESGELRRASLSH